MENWEYAVLAAVKLQGGKLAEAALNFLQDYDPKFWDILVEGMTPNERLRLAQELSDEIQMVMTGAKK